MVIANVRSFLQVGRCGTPPPRQRPVAASRGCDTPPSRQRPVAPSGGCDTPRRATSRAPAKHAQAQAPAQS